MTTSSGAIFYVYEHWRTDENRCFYVGKGCRGRARNLKHRTKWHRAITAKVTAGGGAIEVRIIARGLTDDAALEAERERIAMWRSLGVTLVNLADGGRGPTGRIATEEDRAKLRRARKLYPLSEDARRRIGQAAKGRKPRLGKTHTDEVKKRLRELGLANLEIFKRYSSLGPKAQAKAVICIDDSRHFESINEAARHYGIDATSILGVCKNKPHRKTAGGRVFRYVEAA